MAPVLPRSAPETPEKIFESAFCVARTIGNSSDAKLSMTLADLAKDARDIRLNGKPLIELLASDPEPHIAAEQIANAQNLRNQKFQMQLTQKICSLMQRELGLKKCTYDETAIEEHLKDPKKPLPAPIKHALSLLNQAGFSHLALNVGRDAFAHGYLVPTEEAAVTMNLLRNRNGDVVVRASCGIQHLKPKEEGQKDLKADSPLITFKTNVTLPVSNGTLKCEADQGILYKDSQLKTNVSQTVMQSNDPQFVPLKNMKNNIMQRSWVDRELNRLIGPAVPPSSSFRDDGQKLLYYKITKQEQALLGRGPLAAINRRLNAPSLEVLEKAKEYLMMPSKPNEENLEISRKRNTCNPDVDALVKDVMIHHNSLLSSFTPAEFFESNFHIARQAGHDLNVIMILADVVRDARDISLNGKPLIELLASDPEPHIAAEQIANAQNLENQEFQMQLTKKICSLMQNELGLEKCAYDETAITKHLNDPENNPLPDEMKHALSLLNQASFSHLAHNVGAGSVFKHGYIIPPNGGAAVTMDLRKVVDADKVVAVVVASSCGIQHLISSTNQSSLGESSQSPQSPQSPFITFQTNVTLPVKQGHLQFQEDYGLLFEPCKLQITVDSTVGKSADPKFAPFQAMGKMKPPLIDPEFDALTEQTIQSQEFKSGEQKNLYNQLTTKEQALIDEIQNSDFPRFKTFKNESSLNAIAQARACLMDPTDEKIAALKNINLSKDVNALMNSVIDYSQKALHPPDPNIAPSSSPSSP